jgi:hypothetical protein
MVGYEVQQNVLQPLSMGRALGLGHARKNPPPTARALTEGRQIVLFVGRMNVIVGKCEALQGASQPHSSLSAAAAFRI